MPSPTSTRAASPSPSQLPPVPSSPVYSIASTANPMSHFNLPLPPAPRPAHAVLTKSDLAASQQAYSDLVASAKTYRLALATLSNAASGFASALESCARLKEARAEPVMGSHAAHPGGGGGAGGGGGGAMSAMTASFTAASSACTADTLLSASGLHHLIANHQQILSETVYRSFEVPLLHDLDKWQSVIADEEETYQARLKAQTKEVKRLEKEGLKLHKQRGRRDVARFRAHLVHLTHQLDGLTTLHADHARSLLRESQDTSARIVDASCSLVRAEVDIFEGLARKGWTGGGLDDLLEKGTDLFAAATMHTLSGAGHDDDLHNSSQTAKLFSILPPRSILADSSASSLNHQHGHAHPHHNYRPGSTGGAGGGSSSSAHGRADSLLMDPSDRYQSLAALAGSDTTRHGAAADTDSIMSADFSKPRGARPFSPQPIRRVPADVTFESLGAMEEEQDEAPKKEEDQQQQQGGDDEAEHDEEHERGRKREQPSIGGLDAGQDHE
ncbi:Phospholipid-binding protein [Moelleriella libera RCEF 2490]|uniref:Phospholipid-binding protein n=1 Tax=Moelleriella libera RCEF 2490 TaxID=1081109 RepID=A0A162K499_9HYPO|nr:Phospholipid-binding protein [Moelleriella libera RCEF 2490]